MDMKREDLEIGYLLEYKNGKRGIVMPNKDDELILVNNNDSWGEISSYNFDLDNPYNHDYDIVKIYSRPYIHVDLVKFNTEERKLLWERKKTKKLTHEEIEKILGYKIEIISE